MPDFWTHCGFTLAGHAPNGRLLVTDDLLRAWWRRPEVAPVEESCAAELALHEALLAAPRRAVTAAELAAVHDADARENYQVMLAWRDRLLASATLEEAYLDIFREANVSVPPLFIEQLAQIILRGILDGVEDPLEARAAELFFRTQKVALQDGDVMLADEQTVELHQSGGAYGELGRLLVESKIKPRGVDLDVIDSGNAQVYWARDEAHDTAISISHGRPAQAAFCRVVEKWVRHFCSIDVTVTPLRKIEDKQWRWHVGLDAEGSAILNDLYLGKEVDAARQARILSLFQLEFAEPSVVRPDVAGRPVYLACAMNAANVLRVKPQNLLLNLPLAAVA